MAEQTPDLGHQKDGCHSSPLLTLEWVVLTFDNLIDQILAEGYGPRVGLPSCCSSVSPHVLGGNIYSCFLFAHYLKLRDDSGEVHESA